MCYFGLSVFSCGHAVRATNPVGASPGCPISRKEESKRRSLRTPSLTNSPSSTPRTTIGSFESLNINAKEEQPPDPETPCETKVTHPLHTRRILAPCKSCWARSQKRLSQIEDASILELQKTFLEKARRDKVIFEGRRPRQLELLARRDAEKREETVPQKLGSAESTMDSSSTFDHMKDMWNKSNKSEVRTSLKGSYSRARKRFREATESLENTDSASLNAPPHEAVGVIVRDEGDDL